MKKSPKLISRNKSVVKAATYFSSILLFVLIWWLLSETAFAKNGVLPSPWETFGRFFAETGSPKLWRGAWSTLSASLISFFSAFALGLLLALLSHGAPVLKSFFEPIITVLRSMPTLGVTLILFIFFSGRTSAVIIAALVSFPVVYQNMLAEIGRAHV